MHTFGEKLDITHVKVLMSPGVVVLAIRLERTSILLEKGLVCSEIQSIHPEILHMHRENLPILSVILAIRLVVVGICHEMTLTPAGTTDTYEKKSMYSGTRDTNNGTLAILKEKLLLTGRGSHRTLKEIEHTRRESALTLKEIVAIKTKIAPFLKEQTLNVPEEGLKTTAGREPSGLATKTGIGIITGNLILSEKEGGMTEIMIEENDSYQKMCLV